MNKDWYIKCPVCGQKVEVFDICEKCGWQNSGSEEKDDDPAGPNRMTLGEAKRAYSRNEQIE